MNEKDLAKGQVEMEIRVLVKEKEILQNKTDYWNDMNIRKRLIRINQLINQLKKKLESEE